MGTIDFRGFVEAVCGTLEATSRTDPHRIAACKSGEDFEQCVVDAVYETLPKLGVSGTVRYSKGSHAFPDIVLEFSNGEKYGIEVKSSSSASSKSWKINGNSVLGSTKQDDVIDTYIVFGKTAMGNQAFRYKRYEDAIANVAVTHSPRYAIDMDISPEETFFAKSGLTYQQITENPNPIGLITDYFRSQGQRAWWLSESSPAAIRMFSDLSPSEQDTLIGYCFAHFPEVFSSSANKFSRCAMWLVAEQSIVSSCLRDKFSASGRVDLLIDGKEFKYVSRVYEVLMTKRPYIIAALEQANAAELISDWGASCAMAEDIHSKTLTWVEIASKNCAPRSLNGYDPYELLCGIMLKS